MQVVRGCLAGGGGPCHFSVLQSDPIYKHNVYACLIIQISVPDQLSGTVLKIVYICKTCTIKNKYMIHGPKLHYAYR